MNISLGGIIVVLLTSVTAYFIKGLVGFGPSLLIVPVLSIFFGFKTAVVIATLADMTSSGLIYFKERKKVKFKQIGIIIAGLFIGTVFGVRLFNLVSVDLLKRVFGFFLIVIVLKNIIFKNKKEKIQTFNKSKAFLVGIFGGILGGLFNTNGPPIVMYLDKVTENKKNMRSNLSAVFFINAIWRAILYMRAGNLDLFAVHIYSICVFPGLILGLYLGDLALRKMSNTNLKKVMEITLLVIGGGLILK
jgi:uncharacterized protein